MRQKAAELGSNALHSGRDETRPQAAWRRWAQMRSTAAPWTALLTLPLLGILLHKTRGSFAPWAVVSLTVWACIWLLLGVGSRSALTPTRTWWAALYACCVIEAVTIARQPLIIYARTPLREAALRGGLTMLAAGAIVALLFHALSRGKWITRLRGFWLLMSLLFVARISVIAISPKPFIDVYTSGTMGAQYLWSGLNPYAQSYPDIYRGAYGYKPTFFYGPAYLASVAFGFVLGDIRWATALADAFFAAAALRFLKSRPAETAGRALLLVWLLFPVSLFVVEQAWVDPILLACIAWSWTSCAQRRFFYAGLFAGVGLGVKQTALIAVVLSFVWVVRMGRRPGALRYLAGATLAASAFYGPFLLWDAPALWNALVTTVLETATRTDALTITALLHHFRLAPPEGLMRAASLIGFLVTSLWLWRRAQTLTDLTAASVLVYALVFLLGHQAFCNYYWFIAGLIVLDLLTRLDAQGAGRSNSNASHHPPAKPEAFGAWTAHSGDAWSPHARRPPAPAPDAL